MNTYFNWFKKIINVFIEIILFFAVVSTLYVFTSVFNGITKTLIFVALIVVYGLVVYFLKDKVKQLLNKLISKLSNMSTKTMLLVLSITMIVLKIVYTIFCNYDATLDGDIGIYANIADQIVETGSLLSGTISHLLGMGLHLAMFKLFKLPIHIGMFIVFFIGTIINFISFKNIIGKEKAFIAVMLYILMPSSILLTFCPTHEIFLYMYLSISIFLINKLITETNNIYKIIELVLLIVNSVLACFVNPSGYIALIIIGLIIVLSKLTINKKILIIISLVLSILASSLVGNITGGDSFETEFNTYAILIHGSNPQSLGEQVDSYPVQSAAKYLDSIGLHETHDNVLMAEKVVLMNHYKYLISHPLTLAQLVIHKFYILWSGNHYSIEMAHNFGALGDIVFYILLCISTLLYLFVLTVGLVFSSKKDDDISISNYKLAVLGCFGITMLSVVLNKYSLYVTLFIYLISFYKIDIDENK